MAKKNKQSISPWILFIAGTLLLTGGWLMKLFPVLIFAGLAPLFAIVDQGKEEERFWNLSELILAALAVSFFAAHIFEFSFLVPSISQAITLTLAFVAYSFAYQSLGARFGKFNILIFWLGIEYIMVKLPYHSHILFLADSLQLKPEWVSWNIYTGYLGGSLWILIVNLFLYLGLLKTEKVSWPYLMLAVIFLVVPLAFSYVNNNPSITRVEMIELYKGGSQSLNKTYSDQGELIPRTAAWVSLLIILFSVVKTKTRK